MAEFKARALGDIVKADKIRDGQLLHKEVLEYLEDESVVPEVNLDLPEEVEVTHGLSEMDE